MFTFLSRIFAKVVAVVTAIFLSTAPVPAKPVVNEISKVASTTQAVTQTITKPTQPKILNILTSKDTSPIQESPVTNVINQIKTLVSPGSAVVNEPGNEIAPATVVPQVPSIPTKIRVLSGSNFTDDPHRAGPNAIGSGCGGVWFAAAILDQYGKEMANQLVTMNTPAGSISKTITEKDFFMENYLSAGVQGPRFNYNPATYNVRENIIFSSGNLVATTSIWVSNPIVPFAEYIRQGIEQANIRITKIQQADGSIKEEWVLSGTGDLIDQTTLTCITKYPVLE